MQTPMTLTITARLAGRCLGAIVAILASLNLLVLLLERLGHPTLRGLSHMLTMDAEGNLPTLISCVYWLLAATLAFIIAQVNGKKPRMPDLRWIGLSLIMCFLALDEFSQLHETLSEPTRKLLGYQHFFVSWILPVGAVTLMIAAFYARLVLSLPRRTRRLFIASGIVFISGAAGFEALGNWIGLHTVSPLPYELSAIVEETLEMLGVTLLISSLIAYFEDTRQVVAVRIGTRESDRDAGETS